MMNRSLRPRKSTAGSTPFRQGIASLQMSPSTSNMNVEMKGRSQLPVTNHRRLFADITEDLVNREPESSYFDEDSISVRFDSPVKKTSAMDIIGEQEEEEEVESDPYLSDDEKVLHGFDDEPKRKRWLVALFMLVLSMTGLLVFTWFLLESDSVDVLDKDNLLLSDTNINNDFVNTSETSLAEVATPPEEDEKDKLVLVDSYELKQLVKEAVDKAMVEYQMEEIGLGDFASAEAGATVVQNLTSPTCSQFPTYSKNIFATLWKHFFGSKTRIFGPEMAISDPTSPGNCWPMEGNEGVLTVKLVRPIILKKITVEHILPQQSLDGNISSAPHEFEIYGGNLARGLRHWFGRFAYDSRMNKQKQNFNVQMPLAEPVDTVQMRILSNNGRKEFTCLYRFRAHGIIQ